MTCTRTRVDSRGKLLKSGFTLAEILVSLAIIAVLAAVLVPALNNQLSKGEAGRVAGDLGAIQSGAQAFLSDVHRYPGDIGDLLTTPSGTDALDQPYPPALVPKWKGPYLGKTVVGVTALGTISNGLTATLSGGVNYLTVTITNVAAADFTKLEDMLDEGLSSGTASTTGLVRYSGTTMSFLAMPIQ